MNLQQKQQYAAMALPPTSSHQIATEDQWALTRTTVNDGEETTTLYCAFGTLEQLVTTLQTQAQHNGYGPFHEDLTARDGYTYVTEKKEPYTGPAWQHFIDFSHRHENLREDDTFTLIAVHDSAYRPALEDPNSTAWHSLPTVTKVHAAPLEINAQNVLAYAQYMQRIACTYTLQPATEYLEQTMRSLGKPAEEGAVSYQMRCAPLSSQDAPAGYLRYGTRFTLQYWEASDSYYQAWKDLPSVSYKRLGDAAKHALRTQLAQVDFMVELPLVMFTSEQGCATVQQLVVQNLPVLAQTAAAELERRYRLPAGSVHPADDLAHLFDEEAPGWMSVAAEDKYQLDQLQAPH